MEPKLFINKRYVRNAAGNYTIYVNRNGVLKKVALSPLLKRVTNEKDIWYDLEEFTQDIQNQLKDMAVSLDELKDLTAKPNKNMKKDSFLDSDGVLIYVSKDIELLPIVGNFLPNDGVNAYTIVCSKETGYIPKLKPIIVCWNCHWSELFTGQTTYGNNVFCLASELTDEQRKIFIKDIITLENASKALGFEVKDKAYSITDETKSHNL